MDYKSKLKTIKHILRKSDLKPVGEGSTRKVYEIDGRNIPSEISNHGWTENSGVVIKKSIGSKGLTANKNEYEAWTDWQDFRLFCPVYDIINNGEYIVMAHAKIDTKIGSWRDVMNRYCNDSRFERTNNTDINCLNVGLYKGNLVLVDYSFAVKDYVK